MIPLLVNKTQVLVFDLEHIKALRELGIVGVLSGSLPKAPQQNVFLGVPLQLTPYEALWLVESGHCCFVDSESYNERTAREHRSGTFQVNISEKTQYVVTPDSLPAPGSALEPCMLSVAEFVTLHAEKPDFWEKYGAFCYLRNKGYYLMPGLRFGGAFVAYPGDPLNFHSHLIVKALHHKEKVKLLDVVACGRLATAVKKAWILVDATVPTDTGDKQSKAFSIEWAGFG